MCKMNWYKTAKMETEQEKWERLDRELIKEIEENPKWIPVESSFIKSVTYYEPLKIFEVMMERDEKVYVHKGVPKKVFDDFMVSESKGRFYNDVIRKNYGGRVK